MLHSVLSLCLKPCFPRPRYNCLQSGPGAGEVLRIPRRKKYVHQQFSFPFLRLFSLFPWEVLPACPVVLCIPVWMGKRHTSPSSFRHDFLLPGGRASFFPISAWSRRPPVSCHSPVLWGAVSHQRHLRGEGLTPEWLGPKSGMTMRIKAYGHKGNYSPCLICFAGQGQQDRTHLLYWLPTTVVTSRLLCWSTPVPPLGLFSPPPPCQLLPQLVAYQGNRQHWLGRAEMDAVLGLGWKGMGEGRRSENEMAWRGQNVWTPVQLV